MVRFGPLSLRDDVTFSDGKPLTAKDVEFTFETAMNNGSVVDLNGLEKVETINDTTVKFTLKEAQSTFMNSLVAIRNCPGTCIRKRLCRKSAWFRSLSTCSVG